MKDAARLLRELPLSPANAAQADEIWTASPLSRLSDAALVAAVAEAISVPKRDADTSFLTHAPLELLARAALLPMVEPGVREAARRRIATIAADYAQAGEEVAPPSMIFGNDAEALAALLRSFDDGDVETADAAACDLARRLSPTVLQEMLAEAVAPQLGAAGHAPILLAEFVRAEGRIDGLGMLLRAPARAIAREPEKLRWQTTCEAAAFAGDGERELMRRLAAASPVRSPSPYIAPTMLAVEADGFAQSVLGDVTASLSIDAARRALLRIAALSMLQDDADAAPYGWTHALTMPLAVLATARHAADPVAAIRIAATHALGFRATMGKTRLNFDRESGSHPRREVPRPGFRRDERGGHSPSLCRAAPPDASSAAYHWPAEDRARLRTILATRAATHEDAHLAKYTLAAFDAAAADGQAAPLYLAAAAYLGAWWEAHPGATFE